MIKLYITTIRKTSDIKDNSEGIQKDYYTHGRYKSNIGGKNRE